MTAEQRVADSILRDGALSAKGRLFAAMAERALEGAIPGHSSRGNRRGWVGSSIDELALEAGTDKHSAVHLLHSLKADGLVTFAEAQDDLPVRLRLTRAGLERAVATRDPLTIVQVPAERLDDDWDGPVPVGPTEPALTSEQVRESDRLRDEALARGNSFERKEDSLGRRVPIGVETPRKFDRRRALGSLSEYPALEVLYRQASALMEAEAALSKVGRTDLAGLIEEEAGRLTPAEKDAVVLVRTLLANDLLKEDG